LAFLGYLDLLNEDRQPSSRRKPWRNSPPCRGTAENRRNPAPVVALRLMPEVPAKHKAPLGSGCPSCVGPGENKAGKGEGGMAGLALRAPYAPLTGDVNRGTIDP
jgi:hypothetical protein